MCFIMKICTSFKAKIEAERIHPVLEFNQSQQLRPYVKFDTKKQQKQKKMVTKTEKRCAN